MTDESTQPAPPILRVINSDATPEEIAAIVAVFSALGGAAPTTPRARSEWANPARGVRREIPHSWRSSSLPR